MDRYHSIVGQWLATIGNHWKTIVSNGGQTIKPLKNYCYQWFLDPKTIEKPLLPMVLVTKNYWITIASNGFWTKIHHKSTDINGDFPSIHTMAMVNKKRFKCCNGDNHKANNSVLGESTIKTINIIIFVELSCTLKKKA